MQDTPDADIGAIIGSSADNRQRCTWPATEKMPARHKGIWRAFTYAAMPQRKGEVRAESGHGSLSAAAPARYHWRRRS